MTSNELNKHRKAEQLERKYKNNQSLNTDITGSYKYINSGKKYISCNKKKYKGVKQVHSIVVGSYKNVVFVNHKDYSKEICDYLTTSTGKILFDYNNQTYEIPTYEHDQDYVIIKKYKPGN